jgi:saccharopine dehydrogenase (NADP+, L-glutamate forming)
VTACRTLQAAQKLAAGFPRTHAITLNVTSETDLEEHIAAHDVVISLIPYIYHAAVIRSAIKSGTNVVTTSYVSDAIHELHDAAKKARITVLNEVRVDPGVDHLYAIKKIEEVHAKGARFLKNGVVENISSDALMATAAPYYIIDGYDFVAYPNRDSVPFQRFYGIPEAHTVIRRSLRYKGNPAFVQALANLGRLDKEKKTWLKDGMTWAETISVQLAPQIQTKSNACALHWKMSLTAP